MVPVAVSVPNSVNFRVSMSLDSWAFGTITGSPRGE
jgi:hypothetical protein